MGADDANEPAAEREGDQGLGRLRGVPTLLVRRIDPVGDLDDPFRVRRALEPAGSNDGAGVPSHTIRDLEWDRATPDTAMLEHLAAAFGLTPEELIDEAPTQ